MKSFAVVTIAAMVVAVAFVHGQVTDTPEPETTTLSGAPYGSFCNGLLNPCHQYNSTVRCLFRQANATIGGETCETGVGVDLGRCQCSRNCGTDGMYHENGEFDTQRQLCVGYIGQLCTGLVPHCVVNGHCNLLTSKCICDNGFVVGGDGKHCEPAL